MDIRRRKQLIDSRCNDKDIFVIAKEHKRTIGSIKSRMQKIAARMIENDEKSIEEVCTVLCMEKEDIERAQKKCNTTSIKTIK